MSHEIRTPLNAVLGLARIGARENAGRASQQTFTQILEAGEHLLGVINDVLDYAKIEAGRFSLHPHAFELGVVMSSVSALLAVSARQKGLGFRVELAPDLPSWVVGDDQRLRQILINLLSNAVKFTDAGEVVLRVAHDGQAVSFEIRDTGVGLSETQLARLFQPFEQLDSAPSRRHGGTGLGLVISRHLAELMGGGIQVDSEPGVGSCFRLRLPLPVAHPVQAESLEGPLDGTARLVGTRVLAAEDNEINRLILEDLLEHEGAQTLLVENGCEALEQLRALGPGRFDLVLMDIQMPEMDGYEATRQIRELDRDLPVVGLTAHALAEERARCHAAGMVDHVAKPFDPEVLVAVIQRRARKVSEDPLQRRAFEGAS